MSISLISRYVYETETGRFRDVDTGRFVSQERINDIVESQISDSISRLNAFGLEAKRTGDIDLFRQITATELRNIHIQMGVLGAGGQESMTPAKWNRIDSIIRSEFVYLQGFIEQMDSLSDAQFTARLNMYGNKIYTSYWATRTLQQEESGFREERRIVNPAAEHCFDCINFAADGWVPIGTLPEPGEGSSCLSNCRCIKIYRR